MDGERVSNEERVSRDMSMWRTLSTAIESCAGLPGLGEKAVWGSPLNFAVGPAALALGKTVF